MKHAFSTAAALVATFSLCLAADSSQPSCGPTSKCPQSSPCCSEYGQCGIGAYCLNGCDPESSYDLASCTAKPVCKSGDFKLDSLDDVQANTVYLGDASSTNWVSSGLPVVYNGNVLLTMAQGSVGTLLTSTHYVWYGSISATLSTSQGAGVVTAFVMMSDVKDEIDFEFVGADVLNAQSNYYWQGVTDYTNGKNLSTTDTRENTHTYTIDWTPDTLTWSIDGNEMRTVNRADTWNSTNGIYHYPQSPSRIQLSLWPAGLPGTAQGTVDWAGGLIDWNSPYMSSQGYYYATVSDVTVKCYDPPQGFSNKFGDNAYYYLNTVGTNDTIAIGNNNTILKSLYASGDNPNYDPNAKASGSSTQSAPTMSATPETVPGVSGGGVRGGDSSDTGNSGTGSGGSGSGSGVSSAANSQGTGTTGGGFSQGDGSSGSGSGSSSEGSKLVAGSAVALLGFFVAALLL